MSTSTPRPLRRRRRVIARALLPLLALSVILAACSPGGGTTTTASLTSSQRAGESTSTTDNNDNTSTTGTTTLRETTTTSTTEPTTTPTEKADPVLHGVAAAELPKDAHKDLSNKLLGWWYHRQEKLGEGIRPNTGADMIEILHKHNGIWQNPDKEDKVLYMTMDCGYEYETMSQTMLDIAKQKDIPITFFVTKAYIDAAPEALKRMADEGHVVASHSLMHRNPPKTLDAEGVQAMAEDIEALARYYHEKTGRTIAPFLRPAEGAFSDRTLAIYKDMGYRAVFWDMAHVDWLVNDQPDPAAALKQLVGELHPGSVILLHAVSKSNAKLLPDFIDQARAKGYRFARIDEFPQTQPKD